MPKKFANALFLTVMAIVIAAVCQLAFAQGEPLRGTVLNKAEKPLDGVKVVLRAPDSTDVVEEHITDDEGSFSISMERLRPGYEIHLHHDGYEDVIVPINPQQLVISNIRVIMLRTHSEPNKSQSPTQPRTAKPTPVYSLQSADQRRRAIVLYNEGVELFTEEEPEKKEAAVLMIRQASSMDPDFVEPLRFLSRLAMRNQYWAEASRYAETLIRINPMDEEAIRDQYASLVIMRHYKRVGEAAKRLISVDPEKIAYVEQHAQEFFKNANYAMARALYQALTEVAPDAPNAYLNLGICCSSLDDPEGTRAAFEAFLEFAPEDNPDREYVEQQLIKLRSTETPE